jgi:hypothetical protein
MSCFTSSSYYNAATFAGKVSMNVQSGCAIYRTKKRRKNNISHWPEAPQEVLFQAQAQ